MGEPPHTVHAAPSGLPQRIWPYAIVIPTGAILWVLVWGTHLQTIPDTAGDETVGLTGAVMLLDIVFGVIAMSTLPLRHRAPLTIAIITSATLVLSASAIGAAVLAVIHLAIVGSRLGLTVTGAVWTLAAVCNGALVFPALGTATNGTETLILVAVGILLYAVLVAIGRYRRARAETLAVLRERADNAERERGREARAAQETERLRIAREMHDVLAHRISLVSMHAGALTYRDDLPREKITEAAHVIQESAALALTELRGLLGVLRNADTDDARGPQPTLDHLPVLLADARAAGVAVEVEFAGIAASDEQPLIQGLNEATSRAAYRIVQEALTNARKHAPSQPIELRIEREGELLIIEGSNPMQMNTPATTPSGLGLIGLKERAQLAGGTFTSGRDAGRFVVKAGMPWA